MANCPKCGSDHIQIKRETDVSWGRAVAGWALFGVVGGAVGAVTGEDRNVNACLDCGTTWKPRTLHTSLETYKNYVGKDIDLRISEHREFLYIFINEYSNYNAKVRIADDKLNEMMKNDFSNGEALGCSGGCLIGIIFALISLALGASGFWSLLFIFAISFSIVGFLGSMILGALGIIKSKKTEIKEAKVINKKAKENAKKELEKQCLKFSSLMEDLNQDNYPENYIYDDEKECPFCAEIIKAKAVKCRYCGSDL